jgi:hypothetical protein
MIPTPTTWRLRKAPGNLLLYVDMPAAVRVVAEAGKALDPVPACSPIERLHRDCTQSLLV